jgi:hypothetical protein
MHIEILVEEPSAEAALRVLMPKILGAQAEISFQIRVFQGKPDLLAKLPSRLRAYRSWLPEDWRVVVLVDTDGQDCFQEKRRLEEIARNAGFRTRASTGGKAGFEVLTRLAIQELEAWFFGDIEALCAAYPRIPRSLGSRSGYRDPDAISGGTAEALERELKRAGHHQGGLAKIQAAREIAVHMDPERNRSRSFQAFRQGLLSLV